MTKLRAFLALSRPHFLAGGALLYAVGAVGAGVAGAGEYLVGQAMVTFAQVTAHYVNEYSDVEADRRVVNRTAFSGGSGVLVGGRLSPIVALRAGLVSSAVTLGLIVLVAERSQPAALLGLASLAVSWAYSMPPIRLLGTGWGELATSLVVGAIVPAIGAFVNAGTLPSALAWPVAILVLIHLAMMLAFELPDVEGDREAGKKVLAVRMGDTATVRLLTGLLVAAALAALVGMMAGRLEPDPLYTAPLGSGVVTVVAAFRSRPQLLTASAVATLVTFGVVNVLAAF